MDRRCTIKGKTIPLFGIIFRTYFKRSLNLRYFSPAFLAEEVDGVGICVAPLPKLLNVGRKTGLLKALK